MTCLQNRCSTSQLKYENLNHYKEFKNFLVICFLFLLGWRSAFHIEIYMHICIMYVLCMQVNVPRNISLSLGLVRNINHLAKATSRNTSTFSQNISSCKQGQETIFSSQIKKMTANLLLALTNHKVTIICYNSKVSHQK